MARVYSRRRSAVFFIFWWTFIPSLRGEEPPKPADIRPENSLFGVETRLFPDLRLKNPAGNFEDDAQVRIEYFQTRVLLPWRYKGTTTQVTTSIGFESLSLDYENWDPTVDPTTADNLYTLNIPMSLRKKLKSEKWGMTAFLTPGLNSDFKSITLRAFRAEAGILFNRSVRMGQISLGAVLINDFGFPRVFPAFGYMGKIGEKQTVVVRLPVLLSWAAQVTEKTELGLAARVSGNNFYIEEEGRYHDHTARYSVLTFGPTLKWKPRPWLSVGFETGTTIWHTFEYWNEQDKVRGLDFHRSAFVSAGLRVVR